MQPAEPHTTESAVAPLTVVPQASEKRVAPAPRAEQAPDLRTGQTKTMQVRLPPHLAGWLRAQATDGGRTLSTVVALAAKRYATCLPLARDIGDGLDVPHRSASGNEPVALRPTGPPRELLDGLAAEYGVNRTAVIVAALTAAEGRYPIDADGDTPS